MAGLGSKPIQVEVATNNLSRRMIYWIAALFICMVVMNVTTLTVSARWLSKSQHQMCGLLTTLDSAYSSQPPTTPTGKQLSYQVHQLVRSYRCKEGG